MLVTCLPDSGRLQTNDLGEGQVSVRFVSIERRQLHSEGRVGENPGNEVEISYYYSLKCKLKGA